MEYSTHVLPIIETGCDWITATAPHDDQGQELHAWIIGLVEENRRNGDKLDSWGFQGYKGFQAGHARGGWGRQGAVAVVSSWQAREHTNVLARLAAHWSRVDYQVTVWDEDDLDDVGLAHWDQSNLAAALQRAERKVTRFQQINGHTSLYVGSRSSAIYARCYDKHAEQPENYAVGCWRYETEYKREESERFRRLELANQMNEAQIAGRVSAAFVSAGVIPRYKASVQAEPQGRIHRSRDVDRIQLWLERQVKPSVEFLMEHRGEDFVRRLFGMRHIKEG